MPTASRNPFALPLERTPQGFVEVRRDLWGVLINVHGKTGNRVIGLSEADAAAVRDGLAKLLGEAHETR